MAGETPLSGSGADARHILSFGAGVNSVACMIILVESGEPLDEVVFADTGGEVPETYSYLSIAAAYLANHGIELRIVSNRISGRDLYRNCWQRRVIPSVVWRWSTRDFKVRPIHRYYRSLGLPINQYVGIAYDEIERMKDSPVPFVRNVYPLVDRRMTRADCVKLIEEAGLPLPVRSGCFFCPFNSARRWRWLHERHPDLYEQALVLEENSKHFPAQRLTDQVFRERASVPLRQLREVLTMGGPLPEDDVQSPCGGECMT
jgi:hypothetical protein